MNCELIKEAIDLGSVTTVHNSHLGTCPNCRQYQVEMTSLHTLLQRQPRVAAPANFNAMLQARLADKAALQESKLNQLLETMPAIAAPNDFDFKLRARLAQTKSQQTSRNPLAWVESFFAQSFSFGQALSAAAALALVVTFSTVVLRQQTAQPAQSENNAFVAMTNNQVARGPMNHDDASPESTSVKPLMPKVIRAMAVKAAAPRPVTAREAARNDEPTLIASNNAEQAVYVASTGREMNVARSSMTYGYAAAKPLAAQRAEATLVANVF